MSPVISTGVIGRFSANENVRKIRKVSHFYLEFSWNENYNKLKHSQRVSSEFSASHRVSLEFSRVGPEIFNETL